MSRYLKNSDNSSSDDDEEEDDTDETDEEISFFNTRAAAELAEWSPPFIYDPYKTGNNSAAIKKQKPKQRNTRMMRSLADFPVDDILHYSPILRSTSTSPFWGQTEILEEMGGDLSNIECETLAKHWRIEENKACLSPYQVNYDRALSAGLQAQVFKGLDNKDGSAIAIRYVPLTNALHEKEFQTQIQLQRLLFCRILSRTCNAAVSEIKDAFLCLQNGKKYGIVIMKLYDGDVWSLLLNYPPAQEPSKKQLFFQSIENQVLALVRNLHQCDIWHRDIHLGNILYLFDDEHATKEKDQKYKQQNNAAALKLYLTDFDESKSRSSLSSDREKSSFPFALQEEYTNAAEETRMDLAAISDFIERKADFATKSSSLTPQRKREAIALFFSKPLYKNINQQLKKRMLDSLKK